MTHQRTYGYEACGDAAIDAFFESISEDLYAFASAHHLTIWKYPGRSPMWMFHFLHPMGGFAWLQLHCARELESSAELQLSVYGVWYIDDHERRVRRHYPHAERWGAQPIAGDILDCLARQLDKILSCPATHLVPAEYTYVPTGDGKGNERVSDFELGLRVPV